MFTDKRQFSFKNFLKATFCEAFVVDFYIKLKLIIILRIITYLAYIYIWEIDHFVIKSDILGGFFNFKTILKIIALP